MKEKEVAKIFLKLVIITQVMTHTLTLVEHTKDEVYGRLRNRPSERFGVHTSSRWLNKELKFLLSTLHQDLWKGVLQQIQKTLQASNKEQSWATTFMGLLVLAMMTESIQVNIRCKEETDKQDGTINWENKKANDEIGLIDKNWKILQDLFHKKYMTQKGGKAKGFNPLQQDSALDKLDEPSKIFTRKVKVIIEHHRENLEG